jgi:two-component system, response regulator
VLLLLAAEGARVTTPDAIEILLAEDNPEDAEMTLRALRRNNLANYVHWVKDGEEALEYLFCSGRYADRSPARLPKLVLLDIKMPRIDGIDVLRRLKEEPATRGIPVVVMTSSNEERDVVDAYRLGVNSYIVKPVQFEVFVETVAKIGMYWVLTNRVPH